ncbi:hypothetical protein [Lentzea sp. NPDC060358]|uniref:hypothetical protein n=1 Tax=Lentzea sp. NPDC060358 TaxID=3347103 RepID=UPI003646ECB6
MAGVLALIALLAGGLFYLDSLGALSNRLVVIGVLVGALLLWGAGLLPAALAGGAAGLVCSLGLTTAPRVVNIVAAVAVAVLVDLRFQLTSRLGRTASWLAREPRALPRHGLRVPAVPWRKALRSAANGPGAGIGLTADDRQTLLREGQILLSFVAAALYGTSWLAAEWFYGSLGVTPEEVGLGSVDLLLISGVAALVIALVVVGLDVLWRRVRHAALRVPAFGLLGAAVAVLLAPWPVAVLYALLGAGVAVVSASDTSAPVRRSARWIPLAASVVVLGLGVTAYFTSGATRESLAAGQPATPVLITFLVAALWAPTAQVWPVGDAELPPGLDNGTCAHRLGNADGVTVFFHAGKVFRLPAESVLSRTCEAR